MGKIPAVQVAPRKPAPFLVRVFYLEPLVTVQKGELMRPRMIMVLLVLPIAAFADICPQDGEPIHTTPYTETITCAAASIVVEGERNPEKYETCLGDVPVAKEEAFYISGGQSRRPLPSVKAISPKGDALVQDKTWMVSEVKCQDPLTITVRYWGGGNCSRCEQSVQYVFSEGGGLKETRLLNSSIAASQFSISLESIEAVRPPDVQVASLVAIDSGARIVGFARSNSAISELMRGLHKASPRLIETRAFTACNRKFQRFELEIQGDNSKLVSFSNLYTVTFQSAGGAGGGSFQCRLFR
jgi:hypothetical protein